MLFCLLLGAPNAHAKASSPISTPTCDFVEIEADNLHCVDGGCLLQDNAHLRCDGVWVRANTIEVTMNPEDGTFEGATAMGNVLLIDGATVVSCARIELGPDQVRGRIQDATVRVKKRVPTPGEDHSTIRDGTTFHGEIERTGEKTITVRGARFTQCDCDGGTPSWLLRGPRIDVDMHKRATIYWPSFWISPFGLGLIPITPPLAPLSVPLQPRAIGLLSPTIQLFGFLPTVDLPLFIPLGDSYDLTIRPGLRTDWGAPKWNDPGSWGAPRLGSRLRYAPVEGTFGELDAQWTWDHRNWAAKRRELLSYERRVVRAREAGNPPPNPVPPYAMTHPSWDLQHRLSSTWKHDSKIGEHLRWTTDAQWLSDDYILRDFQASLVDANRDYIPSRTQLLYRSPSAGGVLSADYYLRLQNDVNNPSNWGGVEAALPNRGPYLSLSLAPLPIVDRVHVDGSFSFVRYGPWSTNHPTDIMMAYAQAGVSYLDQFGPIDTRARVGVDALGSYSDAQDEQLTAGLHLDADASSTLMGTFGNVRHTIRPSIAYRGFAWNQSAGPSAPLMRVDEHLDRRTFHQARIGVQQGLWLPMGSTNALREVLNLDISQPYDLINDDWLETSFRLGWAAGSISNGWLRVGTGFSGPRENRLRELAGGLSLTLGPLHISGEYARFSPESERFRRNIYELAAPALFEVSDEGWLHTIRGGVEIRWPKIGRLGYRTAFLLPTPDQPERFLQNQHQFSASYVSRCECWDFGVQVIIPNDPALQTNIRILHFNIGAYGLPVK